MHTRCGNAWDIAHIIRVPRKSGFIFFIAGKDCNLLRTQSKTFQWNDC